MQQKLFKVNKYKKYKTYKNFILLVVETAYKNIMNPDKRKIIQRIIREAKERVESLRKKENKDRTKKGKKILEKNLKNK